jgi:hypothetical protein
MPFAMSSAAHLWRESWKTQVPRKADAGHRGPKMAGVEVRQRSGPRLGGGEHEAVTARTQAGTRQVCASWQPRLPASRMTTTSRVVMDSGSGAAFSAAR